MKFKFTVVSVCTFISLLCKIASFLVHGYFCYYAFRVGGIIPMLLTLFLPVVSEAYWLIKIFTVAGLCRIHIIIGAYLLIWILASNISKRTLDNMESQTIDGQYLPRRQAMAELKKRAVQAEEEKRAAQEEAYVWKRAYDNSVKWPSPQDVPMDKEALLKRQIADLQQRLAEAKANSTLSPDGITKLEEEITNLEIEYAFLEK